MNWWQSAEVILGAFLPVLPHLTGLACLMIVLIAPLPGRGPRRSQGRDPWRRFKYQSRRTVMERAGHRCEAATLLFWRRCRDAAAEADHVYPWSRRGATVVSNGQALCRGHNRSKGSMNPPWWYTLALERRRRSYFPPGTDVRVIASMTDDDRTARAASAQQHPAR